MAILIRKILFLFGIFFVLCFSQEPYRVGTTAASFLEMGFDTRGISMGNAQVAEENGLNSLYWNPAGIINRNSSEIKLMIQPWILDIQQNNIGYSFPYKQKMMIAFNYYGVQFGKEKVTTMYDQEGNGETFDGHDMSLSLSSAILITEDFKFGISVKYINSRIWKDNASAFCMDFGTILNTNFFQINENPNTGLNIGMSISNYGTRLRYDGLGLKYTTDISEDNGNYEYTPVRFDTDYWELPLIFRLGISWSPINDDKNNFLISADAIHPNNNSEYINIGMEYNLKISRNEFSFRSGYHGLFMNNSQYGFTAGIGAKINFKKSKYTLIDLSIKQMDYFGFMKSFTIGVTL